MKRTLLVIGIIIAILVLIIVSWNTIAYRDVKLLKTEAPKHLIDLGFEVDGYNGFQGDYTYGGCVFYLCHRLEQPTIMYEIRVVEWRDEIQSFAPTVVNENMVMN